MGITTTNRKLYRKILIRKAINAKVYLVVCEVSCDRKIAKIAAPVIIFHYGNLPSTSRTAHPSQLLVINKNLAIANRSRVSCAHNMPRASMITP